MLQPRDEKLKISPILFLKTIHIQKRQNSKRRAISLCKSGVINFEKLNPMKHLLAKVVTLGIAALFNQINYF